MLKTYQKRTVEINQSSREMYITNIFIYYTNIVRKCVVYGTFYPDNLLDIKS